MAAVAEHSGYISAFVQGPVRDKGAIAKAAEGAIDLWPYCSATQVTVEDPGSREFRAAFAKALAAVKEKYEYLEPEFDDDDMAGLLSPEERKRGWTFPLTRTQQKKEFGCVVVEQERFLAHLQDGDLDYLSACLADPKRSRALDVNRLDRGGLAPLHRAALLDHAGITKALLDADADPAL
eukprot:CAMPEP_0171204434 /NCGR_PEP_ID=MMETSP0790-20130122/26040_1 /TAXON_ID=2925 /ORGANISM="Alexandrium catenella, Strain OF101" /LENGTH=179 /DNA_ID=CAMNT_0011669937 /DNA_START=44 /DNA_END=579 /DNA_ORIENTATION=-